MSTMQLQTRPFRAALYSPFTILGVAALCAALVVVLLLRG